jgi:hypothetical protein
MIFAADNSEGAGAAYVSIGTQRFQPSAYINAYANRNRRNRPPTCSIANLQYINWIGADQSGKVYVPQGSINVTDVYSPMCGSRAAELQSPNGQPVDAAVDGKTIYVSAVVGNNQQPGSIEIYSNGGSQVTGTLTDASISQAYGLAVDQKHNVFLAYKNLQGLGAVIEFPRGAMPGDILPIAIPIDGTLQFDQSANLLVASPNTNAVNVYAPPYNGPPSSDISLKGLAFQCTLAHDDLHLYCSDYKFTSVDVYTYPAGRYLYSYNRGLDPQMGVSGIAFAPAAPL